MGIRVTIKPVGRKLGIQQRDFINKLSARQLEAAAKDTERVMKRNIENSITRANSTGNLADSMFAEPIAGGWGVGNIEFLNQKAPYWRHCLDPKTEVYIFIDNKLIPITLNELYNLYKNRQDFKILTPTGLKNIIKIGKSIHNASYEVEFSTFYKVIMSPNHRMIYKCNSSYIDKPIETFSKKKSCYSVYSGLLNFYKDFDKHQIIDKIDIENQEIKLDWLFGWIIGFTLAEGYVEGKNRISWSQKYLKTVKPLLQKFVRQFGEELRIYKEPYKYAIYANKKIQNIIRYFVIGKKENKRFNNFYLNTPEEFKKGILKGYNEGDGRKEDIDKYCIRTISKKMRDQLGLIGASLGYDLSILKTIYPKKQTKSFQSKYPLYGAYIYEKGRRWHVTKNTCTEISVHKLLRERNSEGKYIVDSNVKTDFEYFPKKLKTITKINQSKEFIDLQIEDELFLINGGLVSHNTNFGSVAIGASHDHRVPQGAFNPGNPFPDSNSNGARFEEGAGPYQFVPTKPIAPLNYIEKTLAEIELIVAKALQRTS